MTAADLFKCSGERQRKFIVPIYQRVFTWGDREVGRLICDLHDHFKKNLDDDYYLGVITVVENKTGDLILVDGQQRLTCLMLLGALLGWNMDYDRLDYECRPNDSAAKGILKNGWHKGVVTGNSAMDNFFKCAESLRDARGNEIVSQLKELGRAIASHIILFVSELPVKPYQKNVKEQNGYFEKMNAGGRQLEPHEILKVRICSKGKGAQQSFFYIWNRATDFTRIFREEGDEKDVEREESVDDKDAYVEQKITSEQGGGISLLNCFDRGNFTNEREPPEPQDGGEERTVSRESVITLSVFLLHVLALTKEKDVKKQREILSGWREDRLLDAFSDFPLSPDDVPSFIKNMKDYRTFLDKNVIHLSYDKNPNVPSYDLGEAEDTVAHENLKQFQAMLFVANGGRQGKHAWLLDYFKSKEKSLDALKEIDRRSVPWQKSETVEDYANTLCYQMQARWLFWRLDYILWEKVMSGLCEFEGVDDRLTLNDYDIKIIKNFCFHTGRSIEHLHPQSDNRHSDVEDVELKKWNEENIERTKALSRTVLNKDMLGNLCLLTPQLNSAVGNETVGVKLARIRDMKCELQSIKMLLMYKECRGSDVEWTWSAAQKHLCRIKNVLKDSYLWT